MNRRRISHAGKDELTARQRIFIAAWTGDYESTARSAPGGITARSARQRYVDHPEFRKALDKRVREIADQQVDDAQANADELRRFWTTAMRNDEAEMRDRLRASEHLAKCYGMFIERRQVEAGGSLLDLIEAAVADLHDGDE